MHIVGWQRYYQVLRMEFPHYILEVYLNVLKYVYLCIP